MKKLLKYFLSFALIFSVFTPSLLINAKESDETGCPISTAREPIDCNPTNSYRTKNVKKGKVVYGDFKTIVENTTGAKTDGATLGGSKTFTWGNSVNVSISTAAKNSLNSALGFSVSSSYSVTASYSIKLKKGQKGRIKVRPAYDTYTATIDNYYSGTVGCNFWKKYKDVTVKKYSHPDYSDDVWY
ncbi:hypothetical protein Aargi30884_pA0010 (plasmid) [Amedibacterium intestinale]|uniref:Uncharacterized protein n=1 Tax=Amedibacterium intestinale TaxID=2583452 RepID=A0A6N4TLV8_9FIRM|nr:hypothetical protein [Amedibacterium intestinale]BBK24060.1 hypothetical protein Aargi30884_pA0010 [Amedibacterium intestinale]